MNNQNQIYKQLEEKHYDSTYSKGVGYYYPDDNEISNNDKVNIAARRFIENRTMDILKILKQGEMLDYGCAIGEKTYKYSSPEWKITGIDISTKSIEVANEISGKLHINSAFIVMDCENLSFEKDRFDIIYDFGTFSSLDITKALPELIRVMKKDGYLIAIETLGNNPITALKRRINALRGSRTRWSVNHILKINDLVRISKEFEHSEITYFSLTTIYISPFLSLFPKNKHFAIIGFFEKIDRKLLKYRFFQYMAFKAVAILSKPLIKSQQ